MRGGFPADVDRLAQVVAAQVLFVLFALALALALAPALAVGSVLRQDLVLPADAAPLLELDVNGTLGLVGRRGVNAHPIAPYPGPHCHDQVPELLLESFVEVEVDEGVVDVGAFGKEGREHKALGGHVPVALVEDEEERHDGVRSPGDHEAEADPEKHLWEEDVVKLKKTLDMKKEKPTKTCIVCVL